MLALALTLLFTITGIAAILTIADSAIKAREAYGRLMQEAALMQAGFAVQVDAYEQRLRRAPARFTPGSPKPDRRSPALQMQAVPACSIAFGAA